MAKAKAGGKGAPVKAPVKQTPPVKPKKKLGPNS